MYIQSNYELLKIITNNALCSKTLKPNNCIHTVAAAMMWSVVDSSWNVMAHCDAREGKWRGTWRMEWVSIILHTTSEHGVSNIITANAHTSAASSRPNWRPRRFKWTCPFLRKTESARVPSHFKRSLLKWTHLLIAIKILCMTAPEFWQNV
jgi:hypothetical protein